MRSDQIRSDETRSDGGGEKANRTQGGQTQVRHSVENQNKPEGGVGQRIVGKQKRGENRSNLRKKNRRNTSKSVETSIISAAGTPYSLASSVVGESLHHPSHKIIRKKQTKGNRGHELNYNGANEGRNRLTPRAQPSVLAQRVEQQAVERRRPQGHQQRGGPSLRRLARLHLHRGSRGERRAQRLRHFRRCLLVLWETSKPF